MPKTAVRKNKLFECFASEAKAVAYFEKLRWKDGVLCPYCESSDICEVPRRTFYRRCRSCSKQFTCKMGTIMQSSPVPVRAWLHAMYRISLDRENISGTELAKEIGVSHQSARSMIQRIQEACDYSGLVAHTGKGGR